MTPVPLEDMRQVEGFFGRIEKWILVLLLFFLISFSLLQIVLRNFFSTGFIWGDSLLRHSVLWISLLGAARATAEDKHIQIDLLPRLLPRAGAARMSIVVDCFSFLVCLALLYASLSFVGYERMASTFAFAQIPLWWLEAIFPFSFSIMTLRFGLRIISSATRIVQGPRGGRS